jgi:hypothetical protein
MPIPPVPLQRGDRGSEVAALHRTLEAIGLKVEAQDRDARVFEDSTEQVLRELQERSGLPVTAVFDADTRDAIARTLADVGPFSVYGSVSDADGTPIADAIVEASDVDFRSREELGTAATDSGGEYEVRYSASSFARAEKGSADIQVRVRLGDVQLAESPVTFNAPAELRIDLATTERHGPSEFERLEAELAPLLDGATATDLADADVDFLAGETGIAPDAWRAYDHAKRLVAAAGRRRIPLAAFYAWQRTGQPSKWDELRAVRIDVLRSALADALDRHIVPSALRDQLEAILARIPNPDRDALTGLLGAAAVPPEVVRGLAQHVDAVDAISDAVLGELIATETLSRDDAARVGLAASVQRLVGGEPEVVAAVTQVEFPDLPEGRLRESRDLAALEPSDWVRAVEASGAAVPDGTTLEAHARSRAVEATRAFPEDAFRTRAARISGDLEEQLDRFQALTETNEDVLDRDFDGLELGEVSEDERETLRVAHMHVRSLVNSHPGLGLREAVEKEGRRATRTVATRLGWVAEVLERNPDTRFTELDYLPDNPALTAIDFGDLSAEARDFVLADFRAQRRVAAVADNAIAAQELMVAGLTSGTAIARTPLGELAERTGMERGELRHIQRRAMAMANPAALAWFGVYDMTRDRKTTPVRVIPTKEQFFHPLSGYAALLTDQPWCACDDCQSVLSPAAYFVDLMHYVETHILADSFAGQRTHPLHLERRRPDLWDLPLSCANTKDVVPTLDVVNSVLERYIREAAPLPAATPVYAHLAEQDASLRQPFTLPIDQIDTLLGHFELSRHAVAVSMRAPRAARARARLGLSSRAYGLITTARTDPVYLKRMFGVDTTVTAPDEPVGPVEVQTLVRAVGVEHDVLVAACESDFVRSDTTAVGAVTIRVGKRSPTDVQNNIEVAENLTFRRLDRLHRFLRLWRTVPWTVAELDAVLSRLIGPPAQPQIVADATAAPGTLERITQLLEIGTAWSIPLEQVLAVTDAFPTKALRARPALFDRLFNAQGFVDADGAWRESTTGRFTHPAWSTIGAPGVASPDDNTLARLLAGLQLEDQDFVALVAGIRADPALDYQAGSQVASESISLARPAIATLYRHARVRALLRLSVADFVALLGLVPRGPGQPPLGYLRGADDIQTLTAFCAWRERSRLTVAELVYLLGGARPSNVPDPAALLSELPAAIAAAADAARRASILAGAAPLELFDIAVGGQLARSPEEIAVLRACVPAPTAADLAAIVRVLDGGTAAADMAPLAELLADVVRFDRLLRRPAFDSAGLEFLRQERAAFFGAAPAVGAGETITVAAIRSVMAYVALVAPADAGFTTAAPAPDVAAIRGVIASPAAATDAQHARCLGTEEARVASLAPHLALSGEPFDDLAFIAENLRLAQRLGVSGEALARMIDESEPAATYDRLSRAADDVLGAFRAKYPDAAELAAKLEPYEDVLRGRRRDGLVDYVTTRWPTPFSSPDRLYDYFLIDVMAGGCARTSRVVSATTTVQLYVHRVLMNLERSNDWNPSAQPPVGVWARFTGPAKRDEWKWRQHYRVWEANRKVFLYPENYIEPELRDDKTPLFEELEDTLLAQDLSPQNLSDTYSAYLTAFDGLAQLQIAGAYRDVAGKTLYLFGVTQDDAPVYYYRSVDESKVSAAHPAPLCSAWRKVDLPIPVRKVSPFLFDGRLYLFWIENATRPINGFEGGSSKFRGYRHSVRVRYSTLRLDGTWAAPQLIRFAEKDGVADARIVEDPLDLTVVNRLAAQIAHLTTFERTALDNEVSAKTTVRNQWRDTILPLYVDARRAREHDLTNPTPGQIAAIAGLILLGTPPTVATMIVMAATKAAYLKAVQDENAAREQLRQIEAALANAAGRLASLNARIAALEAAKNAEVVHVRWDRSLRDHKESLDSYHPDGWVFDRVYPEVHAPSGIRLSMVPGGDHDPHDMPYEPRDFDAVSGILREPSVAETSVWQTLSVLNFEYGRIRELSVLGRGYPGQMTALTASVLEERGYPDGVDVGTAPTAADVQVVMGQPESIIVQNAGDSVWLRPVGTRYAGLRLGTSMTRLLARQFWRGGPGGLLNAGFQRMLVERRSSIGPITAQSDPDRQSPFHREHPWLVYFRETFLHIPFLVADHLNTGQDFDGAQRWYHTIFDPTAADGQVWRNRELAEPNNLTTTLRDLLVNRAALEAYRADPFSPHAIARTRLTAYAKSIVMKYIDNLLDWGDSLYSQFTMESVNEATMLYVMARDILGPRPAELGSCGVGTSVRTYRDLRAGLTDVSDFLVELETPQVLTVGVADERNLYVIPIHSEQPVGYAQQAVAAPADVPNGVLVTRAASFAAGVPPNGGFPGLDGDEPMVVDGAGYGQTPAGLEQRSLSRTVWTSTEGTPLTNLGGGTAPGGALTVTGTAGSSPVIPGEGITDYVRGYGPGTVGTRFDSAITPFTELFEKYGIEELDIRYGLGDGPAFTQLDGPIDRYDLEGYHFDPVELVPPKDTMFCIPPNKELLGYWDRVEDRLLKIRNCMDISGARRRLDLFAPELDPRMLVRMTAAGLSIDDILSTAAGQVPAYRFTYLLDRARQHAATVQGFGAQLLAALEKGDAEELNQLRTVHEQNLLKLRTKLAQFEIDAAEDTLESLRRQRDGVDYRRQHFVALREAGTLAQEYKQQQLQREASQLRTAAGIASTVASILTVIPDAGAPTAMKFGGSQLGAAGRAVGEGIGAQASFLDTGAAMAGIEASIRRRDEEWRHQEEMARRELEQLDKSITAAEIRRDIAVRALEVHERTVEQTEEVYAFFRERFSSVDRYRLLVKELRGLYKIAFDSALRMAQLAEQAYRVERQDDGPADDDLLSGGYWDAQNAGLLAGEKLLADLQRLERQYLMRNKRRLEIEHSFSLAQLAPDRLAELRLNGTCTFSIPEWFFDMTYPGQYRRRIKAVRVSMPCVVGPYTNVGATLQLTGSRIRMTAPTSTTDDLGDLSPVPLGQMATIATSRAQLDAGVFEFTFRDERYMPFEGAGAISDWSLSLPKTLRAFDYDTISDVIIHLDYTADHDAELARRWDEAAELVTLLAGDVAGAPPLVRRFSLRDETPDAYHRLVTSPPGTAVAFTLDARHFALFLAGRKLEARAASLSLVTPLDDLDGATISLATKPVGQADAQYVAATAADTPSAGVDGGLREFDCGTVLRVPPATAGMTPAIVGSYLIKISAPGALVPAGSTAIDAAAVHDIVLRVGYRLGVEAE